MAPQRSATATILPLTGAHIGDRVATTSRRTRQLVLTATALGLMHHADHVLRADRSGWPFTGQVTAFTASLLVYPLLWIAWRRGARPTVAASATAVVFLLAQGSHTFIEHPADQYGVWSRGYSLLPWAYGQPNLLHVHSDAVGIGAVVLAISLSVVLALATLSAVLDRSTSNHATSEGSTMDTIVTSTASSNRQTRSRFRFLHLGVSVAIGALIYAPPESITVLRSLMQWIGFPAIALSGLYLWQGHRLRRRFAGAPPSASIANRR